MSSHKITDDELLHRIKLSDADLRDMHVKHAAFVKSLNPAQVASLKHAIPTSAAAAHTLGTDVQAADLEHFIRARQPASASVMYFNQGGHTHS